MTNETKPVLLTVAMAEALGAMSPECRVKMLRERGLIAPEPVDALLVEALRLCEDWDADPVSGTDALALAALRRGMELAKPELTREMVRSAAWDACQISGYFDEAYVDRLHAALQGQSK